MLQETYVSIAKARYSSSPSGVILKKLIHLKYEYWSVWYKMYILLHCSPVLPVHPVCIQRNSLGTNCSSTKHVGIFSKPHCSAKLKQRHDFHIGPMLLMQCLQLHSWTQGAAASAHAITQRKYLVAIQKGYVVYKDCWGEISSSCFPPGPDSVVLICSSDQNL